MDDLHSHFLDKGRVEASRALDRALQDAERQIEAAPQRGLPAPRPYPSLAAPGEKWIHVARYWIAYSLADPPTILAVFFETSDIPERHKPAR